MRREAARPSESAPRVRREVTARLEPSRMAATRPRSELQEAAVPAAAHVIRWRDEPPVRSETTVLDAPPLRAPLPPAAVLSPPRTPQVQRTRVPDEVRPVAPPPVALPASRGAHPPQAPALAPAPAASLWPRLPDEDDLEVGGRADAWPSLPGEDEMAPLDEPRLRDDRERLERLRGEQRGMRWSERRS